MVLPGVAGLDHNYDEPPPPGLIACTGPVTKPFDVEAWSLTQQINQKRQELSILNQEKTKVMKEIAHTKVRTKNLLWVNDLEIFTYTIVC